MLARGLHSIREMQCLMRQQVKVNREMHQRMVRQKIAEAACP